MAIDMLELAKRLIPDIETNMPESVRAAFDQGKVKSIFRTGMRDVDESGTRLATTGTGSAPSSHYFLLDDGRAARYGTDYTTGDFLGKKGSGWMGARASVPTTVMTQDDPFVFDNIFFSKDKTGLNTGDNIEGALSKGTSRDPIVGTNIYETFSKDGKIITSHAGNTVKDIYTREGNATFFDDATAPVARAKPNLITASIDDIEFIQQRGKESFDVQNPRLKSGVTSPPVTSIDPTSPPGTPVDPTEVNSRLRGKGLNPGTPVDPTEVNSRLRGKGLNPPSAATVSNGGFFKVGASAKDLVDADLVDATNKGLSELDFSGASYMKKEAGSSTLKNIGSVRGFQDNLSGFITTRDVANATLHPGALSGSAGQMAASSFGLAEHNIDLNDFARFMNAENFDIPNLTQQQLGKFEGLNFSEGFFNRSTLANQGHTSDVLQKMRPLQTALHEMGHTASRASGADPSNDAIGRLTASLNAPQRNLTTVKSDYFNLIRERAFEEARAETFSYAGLSKTSVGQDYLQHLRTADLTKDVTDKAIRASTFSGTSYYHFNSLATEGFSTYTDMGSGISNMLTGLGENVDDLTLRGKILGTGSILGATDFGKYSEFFDPIRNNLISKNREYILSTHGQEYADIFDESLRFGQENRFSVAGIETNVAPVTSTGTIAAPSVDDVDTSAKVADNQTLKESPPKRKVGTTSTDIRKSPTPRGADAASGGSVTPSGTPHNAATTQNLTTKNTNPTTTGPKTQAKINSQTTASGTSTATNRPAGPGSTKKVRSLVDDGLKTAQDLAGGNARLMGIAGVAGLLGIGVASSRNRTKNNPAPDRGTYMDESRRRMQY